MLSYSDEAGGTIFFLDAVDIDISEDGKQWFHLGPEPCMYDPIANAAREEHVE